VKKDASLGTPLVLEDRSVFKGGCFGFSKSVAGEVVFNTGMVSYPDALTDLSYKGEYLVLGYPLIGNYGVPNNSKVQGLDFDFELANIQIQGFVVSDYSFEYSHWNGSKSLDVWLRDHQVVGLYEVDTRRLKKRLSKHGGMLGKILV